MPEMATTERRERRRLILRETILDAARTILGGEGLRALTMRRLAEAVDYAPASLYTHFANREALLAALCRDGMTTMRSELEAAILPQRQPRERLRALGTAYLRFALGHPQTYRLMFMEDAAITKEIFTKVDWNEGARALELIAQTLTALQAAGAVGRAADIARLTDVFWIGVHGLACLRLGCPTMPAGSDETLIEALVTLIAGE